MGFLKPLQITSVLVALYAYKLSTNPGSYRAWTENIPLPIQFSSTDCETAPGFEDLGKLPGAEDVEISGNLVFVSIGLRYDVIAHYMAPTVWQGVFVYDADFPKNDPVKISLENANPHGISLFRVSKNLVRVFVVSHEKVTDGSGREEIIVFDYDVVNRVKTNEMRIADELMVSVNDVKAIAANKFVATNDFLVKHWLVKKVIMYLFVRNGNVVEISFKNENITDSRIVLSGLTMANGVNYQNGRLVVNEPTNGVVNVYDWHSFEVAPELVKTIKLEMIADNINFDDDGSLIVAGWMGPLLNSLLKKHEMMSMVVEIDGKSLEPVKTLFHDVDGEFSVSSAAKYKENQVWIGSPTNSLLFCEKKAKN